MTGGKNGGSVRAGTLRPICQAERFGLGLAGNKELWKSLEEGSDVIDFTFWVAHSSGIVGQGESRGKGMRLLQCPGKSRSGPEGRRGGRSNERVVHVHTFY